VALSAMAGTIDLMWAPAQQWLKSAPQTVQIVKRKVAPAAKWFARIEDLATRAGSIAATNRPNSMSANASASPAGGSEPVVILDATRDVVVSILTFVIVTLFLLAGGPPMLARMTAAFVDDLNASHVLDIIEKVRSEVGRFYVTTAIINIGLGCATAGAMALCGMSTPYVWGILAALLNFIPYAGAAATLTMLTVVAVVTFDDAAHLIAVPLSYLALTTAEGQIVQPLFVGRRLAVNPLLIFLSLWFGGMFWGIAGVILATPALVALKVIAENSIRGRAVMDFLGPNDQKPDDKQGIRKLLRPVLRTANH